MKTMVRTAVISILAAVLFTFVLAAGPHAATPEGDVIKFGVVTSMTGPAGAYGLSTQCALDSFAQFINGRGGVTVDGKTYTIEFVYGDDKLNVASARAAAEKLIYTDKVDFFVSSFAATMINAWAPLANREKKIALVGAPTYGPNPEWPYLFNVTSTAPHRTNALCRLMGDEFDAKSIFYVESDSREGREMQELAERDHEERGLEVKGFLFTSSFARDFYPLLTQVVRERPDVILCNLMPGAHALFIKQSRELGFKGHVVTTFTLPSNISRWQRISGVDESRGFVGVMGGRKDRSEIGLANADLYDQNCPQYRSTDVSYVIMPHLIILALEKAQTFDPDVLRETLMTEEFQSLTKTPLRASGEETFGVRQHFDVAVSFSEITGPDEVRFLRYFDEYRTP